MPNTLVTRCVQTNQHDLWHDRVSRIQQRHARWHIGTGHPIFWAAAYPEIVAVLAAITTMSSPTSDKINETSPAAAVPPNMTQPSKSGHLKRQNH